MQDLPPRNQGLESNATSLMVFASWVIGHLPDSMENVIFCKLVASGNFVKSIARSYQLLENESFLPNLLGSNVSSCPSRGHILYMVTIQTSVTGGFCNLWMLMHIYQLYTFLPKVRLHCVRFSLCQILWGFHPDICMRILGKCTEYAYVRETSIQIYIIVGEKSLHPFAVFRNELTKSARYMQTCP